MELLKTLESLRSPALNWILQGVTWCGEELVFMIVALVLFWCVDKWKGYYILSIGFLGTLFGQFLKLACRIPRPWIQDPSFTVVDSAKKGATGYSFPSGHSLNAACTFFGLAKLSGRRMLRILFPILALLIGFSRMYLGAHFPSDVYTGLGIGLVLAFAFYPLMQRAMESSVRMYALLGSLGLLCIGNLLYVQLGSFPEEVYLVDIHTKISNYDEALKNGYSLLGSLAGLIVSYKVDQRKLHFQEQAPMIGQICKVLLGLAGILAIRIGLSALFKSELLPIFAGQYAWNALRYFVIVFFAGAIWPRSFPFWQKLNN